MLRPFRSVLTCMLGLVALAWTIAACSQPSRVVIDPETVKLIRPTATPTVTATPTATPTAPAVRLRDARPEIPQDPNPLGLIVRCGVADLFDYPLDPPDAETVTGGQDFGVYRQRYEGYHTGEDWWYERRSSLGKPIYSIGNGRVTYAAPYGWGDDLGTLVLEHILPDGRRQYSFYGHIDPESLTLRMGQCVARGEHVGLIGDPRSSPHLHFEIRSIFADSPGPGYWSIDPARSGWLPPSWTIEFSRYRADQRVAWWRALGSTGARTLGWLDEDVLLFQEGSDLVALELTSGVELMRYLMEGEDIRAALEFNTGQLYRYDDSGSLQAMTIEVSTATNPRQIAVGEAFWNASIEDTGANELLPLKGGVIVLGRETWRAYNLAGRRGWTAASETEVRNWVTHGYEVIIVTSGEGGDLWTLNQQGAQSWKAGISGDLFLINTVPYLFSSEGLFRLNGETRKLQELISWSGAQLDHASLVGLMDGGILLLQKDYFDQRLLRLDAQGVMLWERSIAALEADDAQLINCGGETWLLTEEELRSSVKARLHRLDEEGQADEVFQTLIREEFKETSNALCIHETSLLLSLGGRRQLLFELVSKAGS
jgi:murein DD-endopeptidase MepM/ murein hydrolase activator NlpD